jgi:hypothetical protein
MGQCFKVSCEVRAEQFKGDVWAGLSNGVDALFVVVCPTVRKVISIHHRDHGMAEVH